MAGYWPISILSYDQCRDKFALLCVKVLTRKAVCYCNMAVRLFPAPLVQMLTILIQDFPLRGRGGGGASGYGYDGGGVFDGNGA